jgi:NhaP-type Na+/H+ or K+/H+ antiporter
VKIALIAALIIAITIIVVCVVLPVITHKLAVRREKLAVKRTQSEQEQARTDEALQVYFEEIQAATRWVGKRQYTAPDEDETTVPAATENDKQDHE